MTIFSHYVEYVGLGLFVTSELIGMSRLRSNSVLQLVLSAARRGDAIALARAIANPAARGAAGGPDSAGRTGAAPTRRVR
jgi:hypothetical protein